MTYEDIVFTDTQERLTRPLIPVSCGKNTRPNTREESVDGLRRMVQRLHERNISKSSAQIMTTNSSKRRHMRTATAHEAAAVTTRHENRAIFTNVTGARTNNYNLDILSDT